jgi:opacity protein-like surface antigen
MRPPKYQNPGSFGFSFMGSPQVDAQKINPETPRLPIPKYSVPTRALQPAVDFSGSPFGPRSKGEASGRLQKFDVWRSVRFQERGSPLLGVEENMGIRKLRFVVIAMLVLGFAGLGYAQEPREHWYTFNVGAGFTLPVGQVSDRLNNGWNMTAGAGFRMTSHFEVNAQYMYNGLGVKPIVLTEAGVPSANAHVWSISADPKIRLGGARRFDPYLVGGVGYYRRTVNFTAPTTVPVTLFDPFFGLLIPALEPANITLASVTRSGIGGSGGAGFHIRLGDSTAKFFAEARYHYAATGTIPTRMIPVTFGFSW